MAQKVDVPQSIREQVASWTQEMKLDFNIEVVSTRILIKISHTLTLAEGMRETLREFFSHIAETFGLKVVTIQRRDAGRSMSCSFECSAPA